MIKTELLKLPEKEKDRKIFLRAAEIIKKGGVISFPTETVYALGADAMNQDAVKKVFWLKARKADKPIALFLSKPDEVKRFVETVSLSARKLMKYFWPGPLTLIFKSKSGQMTYLAGKGKKLGVRVSSSELVQSLLRQVKTPLTATSANLSKAKEPVSAEEVWRDFGGKIELIIDGGISREAAPSSVVDVSGRRPILLREGRISFKELKKVAPELERKKVYGK